MLKRLWIILALFCSVAAAQTLVWSGAWSSTTAYVAGDTVTYLGGTYVATASSTNVPPPTNGAEWTILAQPGATVSVGTTITGAPLTNAAVRNSGTSKNAVLNFTIPQGYISGGGGGIPYPPYAGVAVSSGQNSWVTPNYSNITALWAGGSCTGYLYSDGTCSQSTGGLPINNPSFTGNLSGPTASFSGAVNAQTITAQTVNATTGYQVNGVALAASNLSNGTTGSGSVVLSNNPTLTLANATGLPLSTGVTGMLPIANGGTGSTNAAGALSNLGGLPLAGGSGVGQAMTGPLYGTSATFSAAVAAGTTNNICIAVNQHTGSAGGDIAACIATLPAASGNLSYQGGGIVDATGYTGAQTIAGLTIDRPVTILLNRGATFDVTGMIVANDIRGVTIVGHATLLGDTGPGKPVIDVSGSEPVDIDVRIQPGISNQSSIGIFESRTQTTSNPWWHHYTNTQIVMPRATVASWAMNPVFSTTATTTSGTQTLTPGSLTNVVPLLYVQCGSNLPLGTFITGITGSSITLSAAPTASSACTLVGSAGTIGFYNYGSEVNHYQNITVSADRPMVFTRYNLFQVPAPNVPYYTGSTTMYGVSISGKSDFYSDGPAFTFDGVGEDTLDLGEVSGASIAGMPMFQFTATPNDHVNITGELENSYRLFYIPGSLVHSTIDATCQSCQISPYSGTITTTSGSTAATLSTASGAAKDDVVDSANTATNTTISSINGTAVTLSAAATATGTVAAALGEPIIALDTNWTTSAAPSGSISFSQFHIYSAAGGSTTRGNLIQGIGPAANIQSSTQWSADLPAGEDLTIVSTAANPIVAKMITAPCQVGLPGGAVSPSIMGYFEDCGGPLIIGFGGTLSFPQTGTGAYLNGEMQATNFNPSTTPGQYNFSASTAAGQFFTNLPGSGWAIVHGPNGTAIGGGSNSGLLVDASGNVTVPGNLAAQQNLTGGGTAKFTGDVAGHCVDIDGSLQSGGSTNWLCAPNGDQSTTVSFWGMHIYGMRQGTSTPAPTGTSGDPAVTIEAPYSGGGPALRIPSIKATTGTRYVCVDTSGNITSSASACSGT